MPEPLKRLKEEKVNSDRKKTIMIVDDTSDVRRLLKKVLEGAGFLTVEAGNGEETLRVIEEIVPDLVLMDIRLPGSMDGLEITRRMKMDPRMNRVPIVALTASVLAADRERALAAGCCGFLGKPIDITTLPALVEKIVAKGPGAAPR